MKQCRGLMFFFLNQCCMVDIIYTVYMLDGSILKLKEKKVCSHGAMTLTVRPTKRPPKRSVPSGNLT